MYLRCFQILSVLSLVILTTHVSWAQDPVFSQYTTSTTHNNPGLLGLFDGEVRLSANYRDQWSAALGGRPLRTMAGAGELRYNVGGRDFIGLGVNVLQDEGGQARFRQTRAGVGLGMQKYLGGGRGRDATVLGFGARVGYGQNSLVDDGLWYSSNIDTSTLVVEPGSGGLPAGFTGTTRGFLDLGAGVNLAIVRRDYSLAVGLAAHHLNWPNQSFLYDQDQRLAVRYSALVAMEYLLEDGLRIMPSVKYDRQAASNRLMLGSGIYYKPDGEGDAGFRLGSYARLTNQLDAGLYLEAIVLVTQVEFKNTVVGLSYDINTGAIGRAVDGRGAYELSVVWTRAGRSRYKVVCPKF